LGRRISYAKGAGTEANVYVTRGGDLFIVQRPWNQPEGVDWAAGELTPMQPDEFSRWLKERHDADPVETRYWGGQDPLAYAAEIYEAMSANTLYVRVPADLKERAEARAKAEGLSLDAWVMRCVERCLA
jgi:hypothetical protein